MKICRNCGHLGNPVRFVPGSILVELLLWLCWLLPGFIYTVWRYSATRYVCASCKSEDLLSPSSPEGKRIAEGR